MTGDFAQRLPIGQIRSGDRLDLVADEAQRGAIAERLGLGRIDRLEAHAVLDRNGQRVRARGRVRAQLHQPCVVTGEPVEEHVDESFDLQFVPAPSGIAGADDEIELSEADCEMLFHDGAMIDIGEALADTLALSVDPYPRSAAAEAALAEAGVISEEQASPFATLARLKGKSSE